MGLEQLLCLQLLKKLKAQMKVLKCCLDLTLLNCTKTLYTKGKQTSGTPPGEERFLLDAVPFNFLLSLLYFLPLQVEYRPSLSLRLALKKLPV